jgi:hypothetical protein
MNRNKSRNKPDVSAGGPFRLSRRAADSLKKDFLKRFFKKIFSIETYYYFQEKKLLKKIYYS